MEAIQHQPATSPIRQVKDRIIARRGTQARNIAKTAAARHLLTAAFYAMRDGHVRFLARSRAPDPRRRVSSTGPGQRVIARRSGPARRRGRASD